MAENISNYKMHFATIIEMPLVLKYYFNCGLGCISVYEALRKHYWNTTIFEVIISVVGWNKLNIKYYFVTTIFTHLKDEDVYLFFLLKNNLECKKFLIKEYF